VAYYTKAFVEEGKLAEDLVSGHRYRAACAAAQAAASRGLDAEKLSAHDRAELRRQALIWLQADLALWRESVGKRDHRWGGLREPFLTFCRNDAELASLRDPKALQLLPEPERTAWQRYWADVHDLLMVRPRGQAAAIATSATLPRG
jgi:hypothetical protein